MRINGPMILKYAGREYIVEENGGIGQVSQRPYIVVQNEMRETMEYISNYSLYAFEDEIRQGFITVQGGHRVGISGKVVVEDGHIKTIKYISSINIRSYLIPLFIFSKHSAPLKQVSGLIPYLFNK